MTIQDLSFIFTGIQSLKIDKPFTITYYEVY